MKKYVPFLFVFLWSTGFIGSKYGLRYASTGDFLTIRTLFNLVAFSFLILILKQSKLNFTQIIHAMVTGLLIHGAYLGGVFSAIEAGLPAGLTAIIVGLQPLLTAFIAMLVLKERLSIIQWSALFTGLLGLIMVVSGSVQISGISLMSISLAIIALLGITIGTVYQKRFCQNQPLLPSVFWQYVSCLFVFLAISMYQQSQGVQWHVEFILSLAWLVLALSVSAILLLLYMIEQGDAAKVTSYFYLVPPATALEAWLLFDESLSSITLCGMFLCAISVFVVVKK